jgi:asparagine synthase (glutamine-hydrolysing)
VLAQGGLKSHYLKLDRIGALTDTDRILWHQDEGHLAVTLYLTWELNRAASQQGVRVMLDGQDGDVVVSHGDGYLAELGRSGRWHEFGENLESMAQVRESRFANRYFLYRYGTPSLAALARQGRWLSFARGVNFISNRFNIPRRRLVTEEGLKPLFPPSLRGVWARLRGHATATAGLDPMINAEFAGRLDLERRVAAVNAGRWAIPRSEREDHYSGLSAGVVAEVLEICDRSAAAFGLEIRHPFYDKRLVEFCLSLPAQQKWRLGWARYIMRRALEGILPKEVQWRAGKTSNTPVLDHTLGQLEAHTIEQQLAGLEQSLPGYVNAAVVRQAAQRYLSGVYRPADEVTVWKAVNLSRYLEQAGWAPPIKETKEMKEVTISS